MSAQKDLAAQIKDQIVEFKPHVPTLIALRVPGMRERHWEDLSAHRFPRHAGRELHAQRRQALNLTQQLPAIEKISESADKEQHRGGA